MKRLPVFILLTLSFVLFFGCEEDLDINADYEDITIVYGFMEPTGADFTDTTFVKITRAYLGPDARLIAQIRDSSEYQEKLAAELIQFNEAGTEELNRYPLDTITIDDKELNGEFYAPYQQIYYAVMPVVQNSLYKLRILSGEKEITSETPVVNKFGIERPGIAKSINYLPGKVLDFEWTIPKNSKRFEAVIRFNFNEIWQGSADTVHRYIDWFKATRTPEFIQVGFEETVGYPTDVFYSAIQNQVPYSDPGKEAMVLRRFTKNVEYIVYAGGEELATYIEANGPSSSIVQERPEYTNIVNGLGLFSTRTSSRKTKTFGNETKTIIKSLNLKFEY